MEKALAPEATSQQMMAAWADQLQNGQLGNGITLKAVQEQQKREAQATSAAMKASQRKTLSQIQARQAESEQEHQDLLKKIKEKQNELLLKIRALETRLTEPDSDRVDIVKQMSSLEQKKLENERVREQLISVFATFQQASKNLQHSVISD